MSIATTTRRPGAARAALVAAIASVSLAAAAVPAHAVDRSRVDDASKEQSAVRLLRGEDDSTMMALDQSAIDSDVFQDLLTKPKPDLVTMTLHRRDTAAQRVKDVAGCDPRVAADLGYLENAINAWEPVLENQVDDECWADARQSSPSIDHQFLGAGGTAVAGFGGASIVATGAAHHEVSGRSTARRLRQLDTTRLAQPAMMSTLALTAAEEGRALAQRNAAQIRQIVDTAEHNAASTATTGQRLSRMVRGNGRPGP